MAPNLFIHAREIYLENILESVLGCVFRITYPSPISEFESCQQRLYYFEEAIQLAYGTSVVLLGYLLVSVII